MNNRKIFEGMDVSGNGRVKLDEFKNAVGGLGFPMSSLKCQKVFSKADANHNGELDFEEFQAAMADLLAQFPKTAQLVAQFAKLDKDQSGYLSKADLQRLTKAEGAELVEAYAELDANKDGKVTLQEFVAWGAKKDEKK